MHGFSEQKTIFHSSCAVVLAARLESPSAALHGPLNSILPGAKDGWWTFSKPCAYAAIYLFRPLCRSMFRFALAGWSPQARSMSAVGRGVRERGWLSLGEVSFKSGRHACFFFQRVLFIRLRDRDGFKISLNALWATLVDRIWLLWPGRSSSNFSLWAKWTSVAFHCFTA